ncbi:hypothetical protein P3T23_003574 [Paraburkholderia sp. GAS448]|jgi:hypothetical protein|uniref:DUF2964 family protein n=1 Tax=Paraburkholderia sp. GAS448 TaxID=3035136 RepID=UPI003D221794
MVRLEARIVLAAIATFVALAGIAVSIHGLLYDDDQVMWSGVVAIGLGIAAMVVMLNPLRKKSS